MIETLYQSIQQTPLLQGGLTLMIVGWLGYQLRALPGRLWRSIELATTRVVQVRDSHPHYNEWLAFLTERAVRKSGPRTLEVRANWTRSRGERVNSRLIAGTDNFWARIEGAWCHVNICEEKNGKLQGSGRQFTIQLSLYLCSRATLERIADTVTKLAAGGADEQQVDIMGRYGSRNVIYVPRRDPATLCLPKGIFESLESRLRDFCDAKEQYEWAGIPWRCGVLFSGPPGTGKTSLTQALASRLGLRIAVLSLSDVQSDEDLISAFRGIEGQAIVLIEDVDCAFAQRQSEDSKGVSFSALLNCIDGVLAPHSGRVLIMTTNHIDRLDPALIRPGRVDIHVEIGHLTKQDASDFVDRVFPHVATRHDIVSQVLAHDAPTPAMLLNRITQERWYKPSKSITKPLGSQVSTGRPSTPVAEIAEVQSSDLL